MLEPPKPALRNTVLAPRRIALRLASDRVLPAGCGLEGFLLTLLTARPLMMTILSGIVYTSLGAA
jgi:hypothetical protein